MTQAEIKQLIQKQRTFFHSNATLDVEYRIHALQKLKACILKYENEINIAIRADLGKCAFESYMCETGLVLSELTYMIRHTRKFAKERTVRTPLAQFHSRSYQKPSPYGVTLIMSPWNYPFMLTIEPLIDALAAGNTAILKPSAYSAHTTALISRIIRECFDEKYVTVVTGGREENNFLLNEHFDYIFFTGSQEVGKEVMRHASNHLTPITLELGGKSPCIVHKSADIKLAAKRIVFGKFLNCGQTCVAPDYIYCDRTVKDKLIKELKKQIQNSSDSDSAAPGSDISDTVSKVNHSNGNIAATSNTAHLDCGTPDSKSSILTENGLYRLLLQKKAAEYEQENKAGLTSPEQKNFQLKLLELLTAWTPDSSLPPKEAFLAAKSGFDKQCQTRIDTIKKASSALENAFTFMEEAFDEGQEMVVFVTELTMDPEASQFITENGCERYFKYNKTLLVGNRRAAILKELDRDTIYSNPNEYEF